MMRAAVLCAALAAGPAAAQAVPPAFLAPQWRVVEIDGVPVAAATELVIDAEGAIAGQGPCNRFATRNRAAFPALDLAPIVATRMACPDLAAEQAAFDALAAMTAAAVEGLDLRLTGPGGRSMRLVRPLY